MSHTYKQNYNSLKPYVCFFKFIKLAYELNQYNLKLHFYLDSNKSSSYNLPEIEEFKYGIIITLPVENKVPAALNLSLLLHFFVFCFVGRSNKANTFLKDLTFRKKV